jgi:DNA-binding NtrC family response regulator
MAPHRARRLKDILGNITETSIRFYGSLFLVFLLLLFVLTNLASNHRETLVEMRKAEIRRIVDIGIRTIQPILEQHGSGAISRDAAISRIRAIVGRMTYKSETMDNYLFMSAYDGTMLVQPLQPELEGTYQWDAKDAHGNYYIRDLVKAARSPQSEGFVSYYYPPPGSTAPGHKLSYVRGLQGIQCYIGTGMFFDDIETLNRKYLLAPLLSVTIAFILISLLFLVILRPLARCIQILVKAFHEISVDPAARHPIPSAQFIAGSDENLILCGFSNMLDTLAGHQEQLIQSEKLSTIGILVAGVAHEINNPNQFIMSNSGLVRSAWEEARPILKEYVAENGDFSILGRRYTEIEDVIPGYIKGIEEGSRRINTIVTDLKSYARTEAKGEPLARVPLNSIVDSATMLCGSLIENTTDHFTVEKDPQETAVECMRQGAFDYLVKAISNDELASSVKRALEFVSLADENLVLKRKILSPSIQNSRAFEAIITRSPAMEAVFRYTETVAPTARTILVVGETGTGKELLAEAIHTLSGRQGQLVKVNVAGLDDTMFTDALFGHRKGAYSSADETRKGLVETAAGGTLFLDEIGDLQPQTQVKLLRLIDNGEYYQLGSDILKKADCRIVAATNKTLEHLAGSGTFRTDLYYRLASHSIELPPLDKRTGDIPLLFSQFLAEACVEFSKSEPDVDDEVYTALESSSFPGNIRELKSIVFDCVGRLDGHVFGLSQLPPRVRGTVKDMGTGSVVGDRASGGGAEARSMRFPEVLPTLREASEHLVQEALQRTGGNISAAARLLGVTQSALSRRVSRAADPGRDTEEEP